MSHGHQLVNQAEGINAVALGTLAGRTALSIGTTLTSITSPFLMKRVRYFIQLVGRTLADDGPILVGVANGNAITSEVSAAMIEANTAGPEDIGQMLTQDESWMVYQNTVRAITLRGDGTEGVLDSGWIDFGGKNGIPALEDSGFKIFAFNAGSGALTTGSSLNGIAHTQGVWLK